MSRRPWIGAVLTMTLVVSIGAKCLVGQDVTAAQMACCAGTDHECESVGMTEDCCVSHDDQPQPPVDRIQPVAPPAGVVVAMVEALVSPPGERLVRNPEGARRFERVAPAYILLGSLLI